MKSVLVLSLVSSILSLAAASKIDKAQLCNEVCWINDINNHDACAKRCIQGARPTEDEAGLCTKCIVSASCWISTLAMDADASV